MKGRRKTSAGLLSRLNMRVSAEEKDQLRDAAAVAGISLSELVRSRSLGRPVIARTDATTIRDLRRIGGLLKHVHLQSAGAYSDATAAALLELRAAIGRLGVG